MAMNDAERRIRDARIAEAGRKNLMGSNGKIGCIAQHLGQPIISQSSGIGMYDSCLPDFYAPIDSGQENSVPYAYESDVEEPTGGEWAEERNYTVERVSPEVVGFHFDGLSRGMHVEVWQKLEEAEIRLYYKGFLVYKEVASDLIAYHPIREWEEMVDKLYEVAKVKQRTKSQKEREELKEEASKNRESWLEMMFRKWGLR